MQDEKLKKKDDRVRNYATVIYPESAPEDFMEIITQLKIPAMLSPLHDQDINPDGEIKKPHYHFLICFEGKKSIEQAEEIFSQVGGVGREIVQSIRGYARYMCHMDNPEKAQYDPEDVRCFGGADFHAIVNLATDKYKAISEMMEWCDSQVIYSYATLLRYAREERMDWFRVLCDSATLVIKEYLKSKNWEDFHADV